MKKFKVEKGERLLAFLRDHLPGAPSVKAIKRAIERKSCTINGRVETFSTHLLKKGDVVEIDLEDDVAVLKPVVLWEDDVLKAFDKPAGLVSEAKNFPGDPGHLGVHRLDKETSGVLLVAKNEEILNAMITLFREKKVEKEYITLVDGLIHEKTKTIVSRLSPKHFYQGQTIYGSSPKGMEAVTQWELVGLGEKSSLLLCKPITGRTHQLRVHLKESGHPIVGDYQYAKKFSCPYRAKRHLLHAYKISFPHPLTGERIEIVAPLPRDFQTALESVGMAHFLKLFRTEKEQNRRNPRSQHEDREKPRKFMHRRHKARD